MNLIRTFFAFNRLNKILIVCGWMTASFNEFRVDIINIRLGFDLTKLQNRNNIRSNKIV